MNDASIFSRARTSLARFRRANGGNVAVLFGLAIIPVIASVGAAVDYARVNNARTAMQAALDTAALMVSKDSVNINASDINQRAQTYFNSLYKHPEALGVVVNATYTTSRSEGSKVVMTGSATMNTDFMKVVGYPSINFGATSTTSWGTTKLRVALALDNTGSMDSAGKMTALKTAAKSLLDQLKSAAKTDGDVYVSIVPFAKDVNVKSIANTSTPWLRWDLGQCNKTGRRNSTFLGFLTETECTNAGGDDWAATSKNNNWAGCVSDRVDTPIAYDTRSDAPFSAAAPTTAKLNTQFPAENYSDCPTPVLPLTFDWTALKNKVDAMQPRGNTNQAIGMAWGWLSLLQQSPFNAPQEDPNFKYTNVLILLSDGDNTQNRNSQSVSAIDARQRLLCDNIKAEKDSKNQPLFTIYTIQVNTANDNTSSVMSYCASNTGQYFSTTSASGINDAFAKIGASLSKLRIAK